MSAWDLVVVICALIAVGVACALAIVTMKLLAQLKELETARQDFQDTVTPLLEQLTHQVGAAQVEIERVEKVIDTAAAINSRVDTASNATFRALSSPVIKGVALASGTRKVAQILRGDDTSSTEKERAV